MGKISSSGQTTVPRVLRCIAERLWCCHLCSRRNDWWLHHPLAFIQNPSCFSQVPFHTAIRTVWCGASLRTLCSSSLRNASYSVRYVLLDRLHDSACMARQASMHLDYIRCQQSRETWSTYQQRTVVSCLSPWAQEQQHLVARAWVAASQPRAVATQFVGTARNRARTTPNKM